MDIRSLKKQFVSFFGRPAESVVSAPGRVNLIGEHTDYNGGLVLPIAIERRTVALSARRDDGRMTFRSLQSDGVVSFGVDEPIAPQSFKGWGNYAAGVVATLREKGVSLRGCDMLLASDVPLGGGLSSSASLEVAIALALMESAGSSGALGGMDLALACQKAENVYAGAPCGIMDQAIAVLAQADHALLLDCRDGAVRHIPFDDPDIVLLVADTQVKHSIGDGGYPARRRQCHEAARKLNLKTLREADQGMLDKAVASGLLDEQEFRRARHVVGEIARTLQAADALEARDSRLFGELMSASHASLRDDFEVSCEELDAIVDAAGRCEGVFGARMTGGGFGGCAIVLADTNTVKKTAVAIAEAFKKKFGRPCPVFLTRAAEGACRNYKPGV